MPFPLREILQFLLSLCVVLAVVVLLRDLVSLSRKRRAKLGSPKSTPGLPALESELD